MNAARLFIDEIAKIGARLSYDGDRLRLVPLPGRPIPHDLINRGRALKPALLELLRADAMQDERHAFQERVAICQHDGELPSSHAELIALACTVPLASHETLESRDATVLHFAEHLDRLRDRKPKGGSR